MRFFLVYKSLSFGTQKTKVIFRDAKVFFLGYKMLFSGHENIVLDLFGSQRGPHQLFH